MFSENEKAGQGRPWTTIRVSLRFRGDWRGGEEMKPEDGGENSSRGLCQGPRLLKKCDLREGGRSVATRKEGVI